MSDEMSPEEVATVLQAIERLGKTLDELRGIMDKHFDGQTQCLGEIGRQSELRRFATPGLPPSGYPRINPMIYASLLGNPRFNPHASSNPRRVRAGLPD